MPEAEHLYALVGGGRDLGEQRAVARHQEDHVGAVAASLERRSHRGERILALLELAGEEDDRLLAADAQLRSHVVARMAVGGLGHARHDRPQPSVRGKILEQRGQLVVLLPGRADRGRGGAHDALQAVEDEHGRGGPVELRELLPDRVQALHRAGVVVFVVTGDQALGQPVQT